MEMPSSWEIGERYTRVPLNGAPGTHLQVGVSVSGPDRVPGTPVVLLLQGMGSTHAEWSPVRRLLRPTTRVLSYDRCGLGISDSSTIPRTAENIARELKDLLYDSIQLSPPFVILCHSFGGIIAREFLELLYKENKSDVVGLICVEANSEDNVILWPDYNLMDMSKGMDWIREMELDKISVLSDQDWEAMRDEQNNGTHGVTTHRELEEYAQDCEMLQSKQQLTRSPPVLRDSPVSVLKGFPELELRKVFEAAMKLGRGSPEQRKAVEEKLALYTTLNEKFQRENMKLSTKGRFQDIKGCGHSIHMVRPEVIVDEVQWVLEQVKNAQG